MDAEIFPAGEGSEDQPYLYCILSTTSPALCFLPNFHPSGVFDSSHANAVREAARAQEVMNCEAEWQRSRQAAEAGASLMVSQKAAEAAASTAEAEAAARQVA